MSTDQLMGAAAGLLALLACAAHASARWGVRQVLVATSLLAYLIPQTQLPIPVDTRAAGILAILLIATASALSRAQTPMVSRPTGAALGFILITCLWSTGSTSDMAVQAIFLVALILLARAQVPSRELARAIALVLLLLAVATAALAVTSPGSMWLAGRLRGPMVNPNAFALMVVLLYPITLRWKPWTRLPVGLLALGVVWETGSRAALIAFALQTVMSVIGALKPFARVVAVTCLALLTTYLLPRIRSAAATQGAGSESVLRSNNSRDVVWAESLERVREAPWIGSGLGSLTSDFETGSSVFSVMIVGGICGLLLVAFALCFRLAVAPRVVPLNDWRLVLLAGGITNSLFEGWLIAGGTLYALLLWTAAESLAGERFSMREKEPSPLSDRNRRPSTRSRLSRPSSAGGARTSPIMTTRVRPHG